jgi:hypothetical protein
VGNQNVNSLHSLSDGRRVFSSGKGGLACLWDLKPPPGPAAVKAEAAWEDLGAEPPKAYRAIWNLVGDPANAVKLLSERLRPGRAGRETVSRGVQVLELLNSPESRQLLEEWAKAGGDDFLAGEAKAAYSRLEIRNRRSRPRP